VLRPSPERAYVHRQLMIARLRRSLLRARTSAPGWHIAALALTATNSTDMRLRLAQGRQRAPQVED
jgi:hypothetical protein